jgi:hypothetical protein
MNKYFSYVVVIILTTVGFWLGGMDFTERGAMLALWWLVTCVLLLLVYIEDMDDKKVKELQEKWGYKHE